MTTRQQAEKAYQLARSEALDNAVAACEELSLKSPLPWFAYRVFASESLNGLASAQVPATTTSANLSSSQLKLALDQLFERDLVAWSTNKGWLHSREPRNPQTKRILGGDLFMTEKALADYGDDLYRVYFLANDYDHGDVRHTTLHAPQWRAAMAKQAAPAPKAAPDMAPRSRRRVR